MADEKRAPETPARLTRKITLSLEDLNASLDSFLVESPAAARRGVVAAEDTIDIDCTDGATCNFKCGPTAYWECGPTSVEEGCDSIDTCWSCVCVTGVFDPFC